MARYEHLPIYKKAMDLTIYFEKVVRNFSRYHKYTLGSELRDRSREVVGLIIKANSTVEKLPALLELRQKLEALNVLLRISKEVRALNSFNSYVYAANDKMTHYPWMLCLAKRLRLYYKPPPIFPFVL